VDGRDFLAPDDVRRLVVPIVTVVVVVLAGAAAVAAWAGAQESDYFLYSPQEAVEIGPFVKVPGEPPEPVEGGLDLLALVEHVRQIPGGCGHRRRQPQGDGDAALHVAGPQPVQQATIDPRGKVAVDRHGVEMPADHRPLAAAEKGARDQGVAVAHHLQMVDAGQSGFDGVGDRPLVAADRLDVDERAGEVDDVGGQVKGRHARHSRVQVAERPGGGRPAPVSR